MDRREFIGVSVGSVAFANTSWRATAAPATLTRKSVNGLGAAAPEVQQYTKAVANMKSLPISDPRNWTNQANIHNHFCPHDNWWFLPWHRAYLFYFERVCRDVLNDQSFTLPYWDWTRYPRIPGPFLDGQSSLADDTRNDNGNIELGTEVVGLTVIQNVVASGNLVDLFSASTTDDQQRTHVASGLLEGTPHNGVHGTIGGDMGDYMSPLDPIFWLHHCNIDRIWASWSRLPGHNPPSADLWKNHKLSQFYDAVAKAQVNPVVSGTLDAPKYGAVYDHYETSASPSPQFHTSLRNLLPQAGGEIHALGSVRHSSLDASEIVNPQPVAGDAVTQFRTGVNEDFAAALKVAIQPSSSGVRNADVYLLIEDIPKPPAGSTALRVFLNCKNPSLNTPLDDPTYVGTVAFFGGGHAAADHGSNTTFSLDITRTLTKTVRAGIYSVSSPLDVSLVPVDLRNPNRRSVGEVLRPSRVRLVGVQAL